MNEYGRIHKDGSRSGGQPPRPQPTASVDAEQVWWDARKAWLSGPAVVRDLETNSVTIGDHEAAIATIQAYGDARADAARREGELAGLEKAAAHVEGFTAFDRAGPYLATAIRALKENPNAG